MNQPEPTEANVADKILRSLCREAWIVTAAHGEKRSGLLATWVSPASIDAERPVVLIGLSPNHFTAELIDSSHAFALHLLRKDQTALALNFAIGSGRERDKFASLCVQSGAIGSPVLSDCLSWLDCRVYSRLATGDRTYFWADVITAKSVTAGTALTDQELIRAATEDQKKLLLANRNDDIAVQKPLNEAWRKTLPDLVRP